MINENNENIRIELNEELINNENNNNLSVNKFYIFLYNIIYIYSDF